jgi:hypothetical protein
MVLERHNDLTRSDRYPILKEVELPNHGKRILEGSVKYFSHF